MIHSVCGKLCWVPAVALLAGLSACGDNETSTEPSTEPSTEQLMAPGQYPVGFREVEVSYPAAASGAERTMTVKIWYPAVDGGEGAATYAVAGVVEVPGGALDAPAAASGESFPFAIYSHGSGGEGLLAYPYAELFASHGWIMVAPNHTGNTALDGASMMFDPFANNALNRPHDITRVIDWAADELPADLKGRAATGRTFLFGHSFGAYTTLAAGGADLNYDTMVSSCAAECDAYTEPGVETAFRAGFGDERIVAIAPQAPALAPFFAAGELAALAVPTLLMSGRRDITTTDAQQSQPVWAALDDPADLWLEMPQGGHMSFITVCDDLDEGLLDLFQPNNQQDGCGDDFIAVSEAVPTMAAYLLGFARQHVLGEPWEEVLTGEVFHPGFVLSQH